MKYFKRLKIWKNYKGSCTFDPATCQGYSYGWWRAVDKIGPFVVMNTYRYSVQTSKHLNKIRRVLSGEGIEIDFNFSYPRGINNPNDAKEAYKREIKALTELINAKGTRKAKNAERRDRIEELTLELNAVELLIQLSICTPNRKASLVRKLRKIQTEIETRKTYADEMWEIEYLMFQEFRQLMDFDIEKYGPGTGEIKEPSIPPFIATDAVDDAPHADVPVDQPQPQGYFGRNFTLLVGGAQ